MIAAMEESCAFQQAAEVLVARDWAEASAGNMSLRLTAPNIPGGQDPCPDPAPGRIVECAADMSALAGERFLVTVSGSRMRDIAAGCPQGLCLVEVLDRGRYRIIAGGGQPTSEWRTHVRLHALFRGTAGQERAIVHCHPLNLIAMSHVFASEEELNDRLFRMHHETRLFLPAMLGLVKYAVTGSLDLAEATREKMERFRIVLWDKHGVVAAGGDLNEALDRIEMVEKAAAVYLKLRSAGLEPKGLSDEQVAETLRLLKP